MLCACPEAPASADRPAPQAKSQMITCICLQATAGADRPAQGGAARGEAAAAQAAAAAAQREAAAAVAVLDAQKRLAHGLQARADTVQG